MIHELKMPCFVIVLFASLNSCKNTHLFSFNYLWHQWHYGLYKHHASDERLATVSFKPCFIDRIVIILYSTGWPGTKVNVKNLHRMASTIFIWRYAESFPRHILGPACRSKGWPKNIIFSLCLLVMTFYFYGFILLGLLGKVTWNAVNLNGEAFRKKPSLSHLSGLNEAASGPQLYSILPIE